MIAFLGSLLQETLAFTTINGASSTDATTFAGTSGVDVIALVNQSNIYLYGAQNNDVVTTTTNTGTYASYTMNGGAGNDNYTLGGNNTTGQQWVGGSVNGNQGNDTLFSNAIQVGSTVAGGQGSDTITLFGASGAYINGNKENDTIVLANTFGGNSGGNVYTNSTIRGGQSGDLIQVGNDTVGPASAITVTGSVYGDKGTDTFIVAGVATTSDVSNATFYGGDDGDTFNFAAAGVGFNFDGEAGGDRLTGATTTTSGDTMTGGSGNDTFVVGVAASTGQTAATVDYITDFGNGSDAMTTALNGGVFINGGTIGTVAGTFANALATAQGAGSVAGTAVLFANGGNNYLLLETGAAATDTVYKINNSINVGFTFNTGNTQITGIA